MVPLPAAPAITILDGGMGHLLKGAVQLCDGLPHAQQFLAGLVANEREAQIVRDAHASYISSGADVITTNNFVATRHHLRKLHRPEGPAHWVQLRAEQLAVQNAVQARRTCNASCKIAGSLPPLQESYQTTGLQPVNALVEEYCQIVEAFKDSVDILLAETLSTCTEIDAALQATSTSGKCTWVALSLEDSTRAVLRSKESLRDAVAAVRKYAHVDAVLLNCCSPAAISAALPSLRELVPSGIQIGAYANGFKVTTTQWLTGETDADLMTSDEDFVEDVITPTSYARFAKEWVSLGATIVGGCCAIGPEHIAVVSRELKGENG